MWGQLPHRGSHWGWWHLQSAHSPGRSSFPPAAQPASPQPLYQCFPYTSNSAWWWLVLFREPRLPQNCFHRPPFHLKGLGILLSPPLRPLRGDRCGGSQVWDLPGVPHWEEVGEVVARRQGRLSRSALGALVLYQQEVMDPCALLSCHQHPHPGPNPTAAPNCPGSGSRLKKSQPE